MKSLEEIKSLRAKLGDKCHCGSLECLFLSFGADIIDYILDRPNDIEKALNLCKKEEQVEVTE